MSKKPRVVRSAEDAQKIPADQAVTFEISNPATPEVPITAGTEAQTLAPPQPAQVVVEEVPLGRQLEDLKAAEQAARQRAEREQQARLAAEENQRRMAAQAAQAQREKVDAEGLAIQTAIQNVRNEANAAKQAMVEALARGDHGTVADAQWIMSDAAARLRDLQAGKEEVEAELRQPQPVQQQPQPQQISVEAIHQGIENLQGVLPSEKEWLHKHPEALDQASGNLARLDHTYREASMRGIPRGTPEYFKFFDSRLGYSQGGTAENEYDTAPEVEVEVSASRIAAPVSRGTSRPSGGGYQDRPGTVTLSPLQREAAKWSGVDESDYARGLLLLRELKSQGYYSE